MVNPPLNCSVLSMSGIKQAYFVSSRVLVGLTKLASTRGSRVTSHSPKSMMVMIYLRICLLDLMAMVMLASELGLSLPLAALPFLALSFSLVSILSLPVCAMHDFKHYTIGTVCYWVKMLALVIKIPKKKMLTHGIKSNCSPSAVAPHWHHDQ